MISFVFQLGARTLREREVGGSNPPTPTILGNAARSKANEIKTTPGGFGFRAFSFSAHRDETARSATRFRHKSVTWSQRRNAAQGAGIRVSGPRATGTRRHTAKARKGRE